MNSDLRQSFSSLQSESEQSQWPLQCSSASIHLSTDEQWNWSDKHDPSTSTSTSIT